MFANNFSKPVWINVFLFVVSIFAINFYEGGTPEFMFFAGVFMIHYGMLGSLIAWEYWKSFTSGGISLRLLEPNKLLRIFIVVGSLVITSIALIGWFAEAFGSTGPLFSLGCVLGGLAFKFGIGDLVRSHLQQCRV